MQCPATGPQLRWHHITSHQGRGGTLQCPTTHQQERGHITMSHLTLFGTTCTLTYVPTGATVGAAGASPSHSGDVDSCQQHLQEGESGLWGQRGTKAGRPILLFVLALCMLEEAMQDTVLTMMPPPQVPGMIFALLLMCPSTRYCQDPPGKSSRMLATTESMPSTSKQGPTMRLHLPTHITNLHGKERRRRLWLCRSRTHGVLRGCFHGKSCITALLLWRNWGCQPNVRAPLLLAGSSKADCQLCHPSIRGSSISFLISIIPTFVTNPRPLILPVAHLESGGPSTESFAPL